MLKKAHLLVRSGEKTISVIACIGETLQEHQTGKTNVIVERQIKAYQG